MSPAGSAAEIAGGQRDKPRSLDAFANRRRHSLSALGLGMIGAFLSMVGSWTPSLWTDEAATISAADRSIEDLWRMVGNIDAVHGGYYLVMHYWLDVFGTSPVSLRAPSAIAVGVAAAGVYVLGRRLVSQSVGVVGSVVFALLPRVTWMGVEGRSYAMSAAAAVWLTVLLVRLTTSSSHQREARPYPWWILYSVGCALSAVLNIYLVLLLIAHGLTLVLLRRVSPRLRWRWLGCAAAGVALSLPVLYQASQQSGQLGGGRLTLGTLVRNIGVNQFFLGDTPTVGAVESVDIKSLVSAGTFWPMAAVCLAVFGWSLVLLGALSAGRRSPRMRASETDAFRWLVPWLVLPTLLVGTYGVLVGPLYNPRYFSFCTPALALLVAIGFAALQRSSVKLMVATLVIVLTLSVYWSQRTVNAKSSSDWVQVATFIEQNSTAGDAVYFAPRYPVLESTVGQTTRGVRTAYPWPFAQLIDLTLDVPPDDDGTLTGRSVLLGAAVDRLDGASAVWVIRRNGDPAGTLTSDDALLRSLGFVERRSWTGLLDSVRQFVRVPVPR